MCLSIRESCLNGACIFNVRTPHCGAPEINNNQQYSETRAACALGISGAGSGAVLGVSFLGGGSVRVDNRGDRDIYQDRETTRRALDSILFILAA